MKYNWYRKCRFYLELWHARFYLLINKKHFKRLFISMVRYKFFNHICFIALLFFIFHRITYNEFHNNVMIKTREEAKRIYSYYISNNEMRIWRVTLYRKGNYYENVFTVIFHDQITTMGKETFLPVILKCHLFTTWKCYTGLLADAK